MERKRISMVKFRNYHVKDKNGNIEMELSCIDGSTVTVHYPKYEMYNNNSELPRQSTCFAKYNSEQIGMLIFAYSKEEYDEFCRFIHEKTKE